MNLHLRQICYIARELDPVIEQLSEVLGISACFVDPAVAKYGLCNTLLSVGNNFLEVVAPTQPGTAGGRYLDRRGGDGGYMVITQAKGRETQAAILERAKSEGVRIANQIEHPGSLGCQLHPGDMGAAFLEVDWDQHDDTDGHWHPAGGTDWQAHVCRDSTIDFAAVELQAEDRRALAQRWSAVIGTPLIERQDTLVLALKQCRDPFRGCQRRARPWPWRCRSTRSRLGQNPRTGRGTRSCGDRRPSRDLRGSTSIDRDSSPMSA